MSERNYQAVSTKPTKGWKSPPMNQNDAMDAAQRFVNDWNAQGVHAEAVVYFSDGTPVWTCNEPAYNMVS